MYNIINQLENEIEQQYKILKREGITFQEYLMITIEITKMELALELLKGVKRNDSNKPK